MGSLLDGYFSREQLAAELGRSPRSLDRWHAHGAGPKRFKLGGKVLYARDAVLRWLADQQERPGPRKR
jgi:predicted DNA-binding transcriptional regulator AlpA